MGFVILALFQAALLLVAAACHGRFRRWSLVKANGKLDIAMLHPDLGLGGAERLVVDAAVGLCKLRGHRVVMFTNFHDPKRAFSETVDGTFPVSVVGSWIPRHIRGRGHVLFASLRMAYAAIYLSLWAAPAHCYIVDQVAAAMPVLRILTGAPVLFYCHYPDQLCDPNRAKLGGKQQNVSLGSLPRRLYRWFFDCFEGWTMRAATKVVCNSKFSRSVTVDTFTFLKRHIDEEADVLYPPINIPALTQPFDRNDKETADVLKAIGGRQILLSINRFERKKDLTLAVRAFAEMLKKTTRTDLVLVMAGGYDPRLAENVEYHLELEEVAKKEGIPADMIVFVRSFTDNTKRALLSSASVVIYTPTGEHFGIVPVEAMAWGKPVVAVASGGPLESITQSREVGVLCEAVPQAFASAMLELMENECLRAQMGESAKRRCAAKFGLPSFAEALEKQVMACAAAK